MTSKIEDGRSMRSNNSSQPVPKTKTTSLKSKLIDGSKSILVIIVIVILLVVITIIIVVLVLYFYPTEPPGYYDKTSDSDQGVLGLPTNS